MDMPGRSFTPIDAYRFGNVDKEKDSELSTGAQNFGAREYDNRLGRFFNEDPLCDLYPSYSPYVYAINSPIALKDGNGKSVSDPDPPLDDDGYPLPNAYGPNMFIFKISFSVNRVLSFDEHKIWNRLTPTTFAFAFIPGLDNPSSSYFSFAYSPKEGKVDLYFSNGEFDLLHNVIPSGLVNGGVSYARKKNTPALQNLSAADAYERVFNKAKMYTVQTVFGFTGNFSPDAISTGTEGNEFNATLNETREAANTRHEFPGTKGEENANFSLNVGVEKTLISYPDNAGKLKRDIMNIGFKAELTLNNGDKLPDITYDMSKNHKQEDNGGGCDDNGGGESDGSDIQEPDSGKY